MYSHTRELYSKDVEGHGTEAMAQPKSREHWLIGQPPGVLQTTTTAKSCNHGHLLFYSKDMDNHGTEVMAQLKSREQRLQGQLYSHGHLHLFSNQLRFTSDYEANFN